MASAVLLLLVPLLLLLVVVVVVVVSVLLMQFVYCYHLLLQALLDILNCIQVILHSFVVALLQQSSTPSALAWALHRQ